MTNTQKRLYHTDAMEYINDFSDLKSRSIWRDIERIGLYVNRDEKACWTTQEVLDEFIEIVEKRKAANESRGRKLDSFPPGVDKDWVAMCDHLDRRVKLKIALNQIAGRKIK